MKKATERETKTWLMFMPFIVLVREAHQNEYLIIKRETNEKRTREKKSKTKYKKKENMTKYIIIKVAHRKTSVKC